MPIPARTGFGSDEAYGDGAVPVEPGIGRSEDKADVGNAVAAPLGTGRICDEADLVGIGVSGGEFGVMTEGLFFPELTLRVAGLSLTAQYQPLYALVSAAGGLPKTVTV